MSWDLWSLMFPLVASYPCAPAKSAGRARSVPKVEGDFPTPSAGYMHLA
jgi:hypothetical protein